MYILGLHTDGELLKGALIQCKGKRLVIEAIEACSEDPASLEEFKKIFIKKTGSLESVTLVSALLGEEVFLRKLELPIKKRALLAKALPFQLEGVLPFEEEYGTTFPVIKVGKTGTKITLYSFLNESLEGHVEKMQSFGLDPDSVFSVPLALKSFARRFGSKSEKEILFHVGLEKIHIVYLEKGEIEKQYTLASGVTTLREAILTEYEELPEDEALFLEEEMEREQGEETPLVMLISLIRKEVYRTLMAIKRQKEVGEPIDILFTGHPHIGAFLVASQREMPLKRVSPTPHLTYENEKLLSYAIEIGLALQAGEGDESVQFRQGVFAAEKSVSTSKHKLKKFYLTSICSFGLAILATTLYFAKENRSLRGNFYEKALVQGEKKSNYPEVEGVFLSAKGYKTAIDRFLKTEAKVPRDENLIDPFSLYPTLPKALKAFGETVSLQELAFTMEEKPLLLITFSAPTEEVANETLKKFSASKEIESFTFIKKGGHAYQATYVLKRAN